MLAAGASLLAALAVAGPATARRRCQVIPRSRLVPHLLAPCNGATVAPKRNITFTVYDANAKARRYRPYLNLQTSRRRVHGHLPANTNGNGVFDQLRPVKSHPGRWTYTATRHIYPSWWDNHRGTYYVQIQQIDSRAGNSSTFYSPIVTIHVR